MKSWKCGADLSSIRLQLTRSENLPDLVVGKIRNPAELYSLTEKAVNNTNVEEELH